MFFRKYIVYSILCVVPFWFGCEGKRNQYKIPETVSFDAAYNQRALQQINSVIDSDPENSDAYFKKSLILLSMQEPRKALLNIQKAIDLSDAKPDYIFTKIKAQMASGEMQGAFVDARKALNNGNGSAELYGIVAEGCMENKEFQAAAQYADSALRLSPKNQQYYLLKGNALTILNDTSAAESTYLKGIEQGADKEIIYPKLIQLFINNKNYEKAFTYLDKSDKNIQESLLFQKAQVLRQVDQADSAQVLLYQIVENRQLLQTFGAQAVYKEVKDYYLENDKTYDSALYYSRKILEMDANNQDALLTMARVNDRRRNYTEAIKQYEGVLEQDSARHPEIYNLASEELDQVKRKVAYLYRRKQEEEKAKQLAPIAPLPALNLTKDQNN